MVMMYTRASQTELKEQILTSFCDPKTKLRIVLATTAFGMGVDYADVRVIYHWHWGPPANLEQYVQESGRAGRNNHPSTAILLYGKPGKFVEDDVKCYAGNTTKCRRELLLKNFLFYFPEARRVWSGYARLHACRSILFRFLLLLALF